MSTEKRARLKQWLESGEARLQPLTFPQRELWEAQPIAPGDPANHICSLIHVRGKLTDEICQRAIATVHQRQEALRTTFLPGKAGMLQLVRKNGESAVRYRVLSSGESTPEGIEAVAQETYSQPFDLVQGPLYRAEVLRRSEDDHVFTFAIHHAVADGWSLGAFVQDLAGAYVQQLMGMHHAPVPEVPQTYGAWGAAERAYWTPTELENRLQFWRPQLAGARPLWPSGAAGTALAGPLDRWVTELPPVLANPLRALARSLGATLFSTTLTAFQLALSRWHGAQDIVVGTPVAQRSKPLTHETMGYYAGNVPIRAQVEGDRSFAASARTTHQAAIDSFANAMPFVELMRGVGEAPAPGHHPVYDVRFALQNHPIPDITFSSLSAQLRMRSTGTARFHLGCELTEQGESIEVVWLSRAPLLAHADVEELHRLFVEVLTEACHADERTTVAVAGV